VKAALLQIVPFVVAVIALAGIFRLAPNAPRRRLRRSVILVGLYALVTLAGVPLGFANAPAVASGFRFAAELLRVLLVINLAALVVFDLLLRWMRVNYADILHDLVVGAAYLVAAAWLMHKAGVNVTSIVATSAVVTAVIGLSLQATLGNVVGGLALQVDDSFKEGDWIELDGRVSGQVKKIRWRHTVIETRDWDTLLVPNGQMMSQIIKVWGRRNGQPSPHRMWVHFNIDFRYPPSDIIRIVNEALRAAPIEGAAEIPMPDCVCVDFARDQRDSFGYYAVRYFLNEFAQDEPVSSRVRERVYSALRRAQIPLAIPAHAIFLSNDDPESKARKRVQETEFKSDALQMVDLFSRLSRDEKLTLAESARLTPFSPGEIITRQGATAHWLYVLTKGRASVRVSANGSQDRQVAILEAPSFFGEMALMTGQPREATVIALTDVDCLRVDKTDFEGILKKRPEMAQEISAILAQRRVELSAAREDAATRNSRIFTERGRILSAIKDFFALERD